ncbi:MAG: C40 family peptidase, partial [Selenomonadaceae bacterium]|nr:C40 family peptidase [Selenomonadaceae bacterium]
VSIGIPAFPRPITNHVENTGWIARLPIAVNGRLKEVYVTIPDDKSINHGWLPCTQNNFVKQAFKFLGDEYGWGGLNDSVDCSSFVGDVYRSMGIQLPRDSNWQEAVMPIVSVFNDVGTAMRYDIVKRAPIGSLLFKRGHVMMYLGQDKSGTPLVIHSASSYVRNGEKIFIRKVIVSDLRYQGTAGVETIDQLTGIAAVTNGG